MLTRFKLHLLTFLISVTLSVNIRAAVDTVSLETIFKLSFADFRAQYGTGIVEAHNGWSVSDSASSSKKMIGLDSLYLLDANISVNAVILYYINDSLHKVTFYSDAVGYSKFMHHFKQGVYDRNRSKTKPRKLKDGSQRYLYRWNEIPSTNGQPGGFMFIINRRD